MATLREFEEALRAQGMKGALRILDKLRQRDRLRREAAAAPRRVAGQRMTPALARRILEMHRTTAMTQQEIAFALGVNQGRVNEVVKHGKWLSGDPQAPEARERDRALARARGGDRGRPRPGRAAAASPPAAGGTDGQLSLF
ncbi:RNA polymerase subunit sigma-70 [Rubellimicrobium sp. CFH 75288]|uniref:RNA polymerase subunit sigma-70 n=1 Tax=Rubellimicrobium sp. CFH 75288 TaxID=2697034 RepID=UPI00141376C6|nr:RNA polymerase subunit sigma-70 [Rubellimicrobium sp. CFH 75288]NAZ36975.1 RNA polymerase subunit sigma-70 [Rubellimicrobium sp. CFH 75288]